MLDCLQILAGGFQDNSPWFDHWDFEITTFDLSLSAISTLSTIPTQEGIALSEN